MTQLVSCYFTQTAMAQMPTLPHQCQKYDCKFHRLQPNFRCHCGKLYHLDCIASTGCQDCLDALPTVSPAISVPACEGVWDEYDEYDDDDQDF